jgi:predicted nuclease of predicted toxin-antitoxin system
VIFWIDAQLDPSLAPWLTAEFGVEAYSFQYLGFRNAKDRVVFDAARRANAVVITKDVDFVLLLESKGPPPSIVWIRSGNTSTAAMKQSLRTLFPRAQHLLASGETLIEVADRKRG